MSIIPIPILLVLQLLPFMVTLIALYFILFKPMLQFLNDRQLSTEGAREKAVQLHQQAEEKMTELEQQLKAARAEIGDKRSQARAEATKQYNTVVAAARKDAEDQIKAAVSEIQSLQNNAREELRGSAQAIANQIASQALGRQLA